MILDTGSSTLAIDGHHYNVDTDKSAKITDIAQEVGYADGSSWVGGVVTTDVTVGGQPLVLPQVSVAVAYHETSTMFGGSNGSLGLAYTKLNNAFTMGRIFIWHGTPSVQRELVLASLTWMRDMKSASP